MCITYYWTYAASTCTGNRGLKSRLSLPAMSLRLYVRPRPELAGTFSVLGLPKSWESGEGRLVLGGAPQPGGDPPQALRPRAPGTPGPPPQCPPRGRRGGPEGPRPGGGGPPGGGGDGEGPPAPGAGGWGGEGGRPAPRPPAEGEGRPLGRGGLARGWVPWRGTGTPWSFTWRA